MEESSETYAGQALIGGIYEVNYRIAELSIIHHKKYGITLRVRIQNKVTYIIEGMSYLTTAEDKDVLAYIERLKSLRTDLDIGLISGQRVYAEQDLIEKMFNTEHLRDVKFIVTAGQNKLSMEINRELCCIDFISESTGISTSNVDLTASFDGLPFFMAPRDYELKPWQSWVDDDLVINLVPLYDDVTYLTRLLTPSFRTHLLARYYNIYKYMAVWRRSTSLFMSNKKYIALTGFSPDEMIDAYKGSLSIEEVNYFKHLESNASLPNNVSILIHLSEIEKSL